MDDLQKRRDEILRRRKYTTYLAKNDLINGFLTVPTRIMVIFAHSLI